jgi:hypothetical protein
VVASSNSSRTKSPAKAVSRVASKAVESKTDKVTRTLSRAPCRGLFFVYRWHSQGQRSLHAICDHNRIGDRPSLAARPTSWTGLFATGLGGLGLLGWRGKRKAQAAI